MRKYYYVCPRCGRRWSFFFKQKELHCSFCGQDWNPSEGRYKKLHGSYFSWSAFLTVVAAVCAIGYGAMKAGDKLGYDATNKVRSFVGLPAVEPHADGVTLDLEHLEELRNREMSDKPSDGDTTSERQSSGQTSESSAVGQSETLSETTDTPSRETVPLGRVTERAPNDTKPSALDALINESLDEAAAAKSDNDWDF